MFICGHTVCSGDTGALFYEQEVDALAESTQPTQFLGQTRIAQSCNLSLGLCADRLVSSSSSSGSSEDRALSPVGKLLLILFLNTTTLLQYT